MAPQGEQANRYWVVDVYEDGIAELSVASGEEIEYLKESGDYEDWQIARVTEKSEEEMVETIEEKDLTVAAW